MLKWGFILFVGIWLIKTLTRRCMILMRVLKTYLILFLKNGFLIFTKLPVSPLDIWHGLHGEILILFGGNNLRLGLRKLRVGLGN